MAPPVDLIFLYLNLHKQQRLFDLTIIQIATVVLVSSGGGGSVRSARGAVGRISRIASR